MAYQDGFDSLLNSKCSVWRKGGSGVVDNYGIESQVFTLLKSDIPCTIDPGSGKELASNVAYGLQEVMFYMRPIMVDDPPIPLNIHHWLQINETNGIGADGRPYQARYTLDPAGTMYDIKNIKNPKMMNHHLEIQTELIEP